jgi:hypothetical protein
MYVRQIGSVNMSHNPLSRFFRPLVKGAMASAMILVGLVTFSTVAGANAANPNADTAATGTVNSDGTVTVTMSGTWIWASQSTCSGRYGEGWAVDWWGISTSSTPSPNTSLTGASIVSTPGTTTTGTITATGTAPGTLSGGQFFHVSSDLNGEVVNSVTGCTETSGGITGAWSASATYPSQSAIPPAICVNMYDLHLKGDGPDTADFDPSSNNDNSIKTNAFDPTVGDGYCATPHIVTPPTTTTTTIATSPAATPATPTTPAPATAPAKAVAGATLAFTGEPWAGSQWIELSVLVLGMGLMSLGLLRRRSLRRAHNNNQTR